MTGEGLNLIMENLEDSDPFVKRNISEMLSILTILQEVQTRFEVVLVEGFEADYKLEREYDRSYHKEAN